MIRSAGKQGKRAESFLPSDWVLYDDVYVILKETEEADYHELGGQKLRGYGKRVSKEIEFDEFKIIPYVREADGEFKYLIRRS
jgi:hypothetical protein